MINVGLVGFGLSGKFLQAPFFMSHGSFNLKTIVTSQAIPLEFFPITKRVSDFKDLLDDADLHLISICSPSSTHYDYAKAALMAGKNVLVEKPFTATSIEAVELFDLAKSKSLHIFVYQNRRFDSDFLTLKSCIDSGVLGEIHTYEANFDRYKPILNAKKWKEIQAPGNGILFDLGSHIIDQCLSLFGKPISVEGEVFTQRQDSEIDDAFRLVLNYGFLKVHLNASLLMKSPRPRFSVHGTKGSFVKHGIDIQEDCLVANIWPVHSHFGFELESNQASLCYLHQELDIDTRLKTKQGNWMALYQNIADVILKGAKPFFNPEEIIWQLEIIESIKKPK